jgi:hypothetical protein
MITAVVQLKAPLERGAPGSVTTRKLHISDLPKPPKTWKDLEKYPYGEYFVVDVKLEMNNL